VSDLESDLGVPPQMERSAPATRLLVVGSELWWVRSIQSLFEPYSYEVYGAGSSERALQHLSVSEPDAIIVHARLTDSDGIQLVNRMFAAGVGKEHPVILISEEPLRRELRLEAFRSGVWDCLSAPLNGEELLLKLESYLGASRVARRARESLLLDEASGLYNARGIRRWARELAHSARRYHRPLGCAVFAPAEPREETATSTPSPTSEAFTAAIVERLVTLGRTSDIIGRTGPSEFAVLASETGPDGILTMASRFIQPKTAEASGSDVDSRLELRAGCFAVPDLAAEHLEPEELITRATLALRRSLNEGTGSVTFFAN
jgi:DNA-binding response OmpR family regulator